MPKSTPPQLLAVASHCCIRAKTLTRRQSAIDSQPMCAPHHTPQLCNGAVTAPMRQANAKNAQRNVTWEKIVDFGQNATHTLTHAYIGYTISVKRLNMPMVAANCFFVQQYFCRLAYYWGDIVRRVSRVFKLALNHS